MASVANLEVTEWKAPHDATMTDRAISELEAGRVLLLPRLPFTLLADERRFLAPSWSDEKAKNVSYDHATRQINHTPAQGEDRRALAAMMGRYAQHAHDLITSLCPGYARDLEWGMTSYRPFEVRGRRTSPKKDDARLHVDAFASRPNQGRRILRVFSNINPRGEPRLWELGEDFAAVARRYSSHVPRQLPGSAWLLQKLHVTKGQRSAYDHVMLNLHDLAKLDEGYQRTSPKTPIQIPAASTWIVFTDYVMHAALGGQFVLEQTFYLPVLAMRDQQRAPLRILEQLYQRSLA